MRSVSGACQSSWAAHRKYVPRDSSNVRLKLATRPTFVGLRCSWTRVVARRVGGADLRCGVLRCVVADDDLEVVEVLAEERVEGPFDAGRSVVDRKADADQRRSATALVLACRPASSMPPPNHALGASTPPWRGRLTPPTLGPGDGPDVPAPRTGDRAASGGASAPRWPGRSRPATTCCSAGGSRTLARADVDGSAGELLGEGAEPWRVEGGHRRHGDGPCRRGHGQARRTRPQHGPGLGTS